MKCEIKAGKIILPEEFTWPEGEVIIVPGEKERDVRLYSLSAWKKLNDDISAISDDTLRKRMQRILLSHAEIIPKKKNKIKLSKLLREYLYDTMAEIVDQDGVFIIRNISDAEE